MDLPIPLQIIDLKLKNYQSQLDVQTRRTDFLMVQMNTQDSDVARAAYDAAYQDLLTMQNHLEQLKLFRQLEQDKPGTLGWALALSD